MKCWVGLMSGTSLDGVDAVLADESFRDLAHVHRPFTPALRADLLALNDSGADELQRAALAANAIAQAYAAAVHELLARAGCPTTAVRALGAHGQTVRHRPGSHDGTGYTLQLINGALLAELTGIDVVCDFRSRDLAAGGQGAPLVPAFHAARFAGAGCDAAVLNLGGIANLTLLPADGPVGGFDCGPGNVLIDLWAQQHLGQPFDAGGRWASQGRVCRQRLALGLADPYFSQPAPKSTGRDLFNPAWLQRWLTAGEQAGSAASPQDIAATLTALTIEPACQALLQALPGVRRLTVCGGGAHNLALMDGLRQRLGPGVQVLDSVAASGLAPDRVEALAFAWLAAACVERRAGNMPAVTGAVGPRVLGALYPAGPI